MLSGLETFNFLCRTRLAGLLQIAISRFVRVGAVKIEGELEDTHAMALGSLPR